jgi:DNA-binding LacI/PurR family transcriptional regulator
MLSGETRFRQRVDGMILVDVMCREAGARRLARLDVPVVVLGEELHAVDSVSVDNVAGAAMAAQHLIELGHRHIGVVGGHSNAEDEHDVPNDRTNGFRRALATAGVGLPDHLVRDGGFTIDGGRRAMHALMQLAQPPTGVFAMSDEMGFGALQALRERGLVAGRDVSVVGFDDHPVSDAAGLTTVRQPVRTIGRFGAQVLLERLEGIGTTHHREMPLSLVVRATTGVPHSAS